MQQKGDNVTNWIEKIPKKFVTKQTKDPTYKNHLIKPNSMILSVGATGVGKTNGSVVEFLHRKNGRFFEIIIFTGSSSDEVLYNFLASSIDGLKLIDDPLELPKIEHYKNIENKDFEKVIVFDDSCQSDKKVLKEIQKWFMMARKLGFTCIFLSQDYTSTPIFIRRNCHYLQLFKLTDMRDVKNILSKCALDVDLNTLKNMLNYATKERGQFLTIHLAGDVENKYRKCYNEVLNPNDFK